MKTKDLPGFIELSISRKIEHSFSDNTIPSDYLEVVELYEDKYISGELDYIETKNYLKELNFINKNFKNKTKWQQELKHKENF